MNGAQALIGCLARLPGVGRRTAERIATRLVMDRDGLLRELVAALQEAAASVMACGVCGGLTTAGRDPCELCTSPRRDGEILCVVEEPTDIALIERAGAYRGRYHALMGKVSPMHGEGPADLRVKALLDRVAAGTFHEVILALSTDVEGESTAAYLTELLRPLGLRITRPAMGLPARSGIGYSDPVTLERAFKARVNEEGRPA